MTRNAAFSVLVATCALFSMPASPQAPSQSTPVRGGNAPGLQGLQIAPNPGAPMVQSTEATLRHDLELAKKKIADLTKALADCQKGFDDCKKARDTAQAKANVRMFCADNVTSKNSLGASERCSPYVCSPVSGQCVKRCGTSADCEGGFVCDTGIGACVSAR